MNLQAINDWPITDYNFAGNGATAAQNPVPAAFSVDTGALAVPAGTVAGNPLWVDGFMSRFGSAPPDLGAAVAVNNEASVQVAGGQLGGGASTAPGTGMCGLGSQVCDPASLQVLWATRNRHAVRNEFCGRVLHQSQRCASVVRCYQNRSGEHRYEIAAGKSADRPHRRSP